MSTMAEQTSPPPTTKTYSCKHCPATFANPVVLGGHVHAAHPEHRRKAPKWLRTGTARPARPSLKRDTDIWPGRP